MSRLVEVATLHPMKGWDVSSKAFAEQLDYRGDYEMNISTSSDQSNRKLHLLSITKCRTSSNIAPTFGLEGK